VIAFRIQSTPNPNARKYIINEEVKAEGKSTDECTHVPMAYALLNTPHVHQVHLFENVLTLTQDGKADWKLLDQEVQGIVIAMIKQHDIFFVDHPHAVTEKLPLEGELAVIDEILERTIRPSLQMDGGDIELVEIDRHVLTMRYMGACGGCPSSQLGTLEAIKSILRTEYREDIEVVTV
jgi:Fe-S cluster biogenesis protein NfuA